MTRQTRIFVQVAVFLSVLLIGCRQAGPDSGFAQADVHAADVGQKVQAAAQKVSGTGEEIVATATAGQQATPIEVRPRLDPYWLKLIASGQFLLVQGDALSSIRKDVEQLRAEVQAGQKQLHEAVDALEAEKSGRAKDNKQWEDKLAAANSRWEAMFRKISWIAIAAIGISVALGVLMHDFRISVAGGAGGMAVVIASMLAGQIQAWLPWVAGGLAAVVVLWITVEAFLRGSLREAIRTNPIQDVKDLLHPASSPAAGVEG